MGMYFMLWVIIQYYILLLLELSQLWLLGTPPGWLLWPLPWPHPFVFGAFPDFLEPQDIPGCSRMTPVTALEPTISLKWSHSFRRRMVSETKVWSWLVVAMRVLSFLGPLSRQRVEMYVCI